MTERRQWASSSTPSTSTAKIVSNVSDAQLVNDLVHLHEDDDDGDGSDDDNILANVPKKIEAKKM